MAIDLDLIDTLLADYKKPEDIIGENGLLKQLTKALPAMAKAARFSRLRELFEQHLAETEAQIERLTQCFQLIGENARAKPCKGMMGLVEEVTVIDFGKHGLSETFTFSNPNATAECGCGESFTTDADKA